LGRRSGLIDIVFDAFREDDFYVFRIGDNVERFDRERINVAVGGDEIPHADGELRDVEGRFRLLRAKSLEFWTMRLNSLSA